MCLKAWCDNCDKEYEYNMKDVNWLRSGEGRSGDDTVHWGEGQVDCPECKTPNYISVSD
jgi:hypothetical protein